MFVTPAKDRAALLKEKPFEELYDLNTLKPKKEYLESTTRQGKKLQALD